jgi:hypothetical protein
MTSLVLELVQASETSDLIRGKVVKTKPKRPTRARRVTVHKDEPDLIAAK